MFIRLLAASLLLLSSFTANADHRHDTKYQDEPSAFRCYDANNGLMKGLWKPRDARLIERVGGSCDERGRDDGDVSELKAEALSNKDISKALRNARKRFPELLYDAWLIGARDVNGNSFKYVKYALIYKKPDSDERIRVEVKQNYWSGKIKHMKPTVLRTARHKQKHHQQRHHDEFYNEQSSRYHG